MSDLVKSELKKAIEDLNDDLEEIGLENISEKDIKLLSKSIIFDSLKKELSNKAKSERTDIEKLKNDFILSPSIKGKHRPIATQKAYKKTLDDFFDYCQLKNINPLLINRIEVEKYLNSLKTFKDPNEDLSIKSKNAKLSYLKSFYEYLVSYDFLDKNPVRNIKRFKPSALDQKNNIDNKRKRIPSEEDIQYLLESFKEHPGYYNSILMMAYRGLRISALEGLRIKDGKYSTISKEKYIEGSMSEALIDLSGVNTFYKNKNSFQTLFSRRVKKLIEIKNKDIPNEEKCIEFSFHDLRHFYGINHYLKYRDIYRTSKALNHASIGVTQNYLRGLKIEV